MTQTPGRKATQPGLGKVVKADPRRTTERPRFEHEDGAEESAPTSHVPQGVNAISSDTPPPKSGPMTTPGRATPPAATKWFTPPPEGSFRNPKNDTPPWTKHPTSRLGAASRGAGDATSDAGSRAEPAPVAHEHEYVEPSSVRRGRGSSVPAPGHEARKSTASATPAAKRTSTAPPKRGNSTAPPKRGNSTAPPGLKKKKNRQSIRIDDVGHATAIVADDRGIGGRMVPRVMRTKQELAAAPIDHREGFVLALIDGKTTVQGVVDVSGMEEPEVLAILERLRRLGIVAIH